ncbi:MAG: site-specific integrase [Oscillospiraceae bacterium]
MAYVQLRYNKTSEVISYSVRVHKDEDGKNLKPYTASFSPDLAKTAKQNEKALNKFVVEFEGKCKSGLVADTRQTFAQYAEYVIALKERTGVKRRTIELYRYLLKRTTQAIGHIRIGDLKAQHLNIFYEQLSQEGVRGNQARCKPRKDFKEQVKAAGYTQKALSEKAGLCINTIETACAGKTVEHNSALKLAEALGKDVSALFTVAKNQEPLSNKTINEYHRFISAVLNQAEKESLILFSPSRKATPPKITVKPANYFQLDDIEQIRDCLEAVPIKWKAIVHLFLITGARRGEIAGLKWSCIDWKNNKIHICRNLLYSPEIGLYEDSTKTTSSDRWVKLPPETMELLKQYRLWYMEQSSKYGSLWHNSGFLFFQEKSGNEGKPMTPTPLTRGLWSSQSATGFHILTLTRSGIQWLPCCISTAWTASA